MAVTSGLCFSRLAGFSLTTADADALAAFYVRAFGCRRAAGHRLEGAAFHDLMGVHSDARCVPLRLGADSIDLVEFDRPGAPYPQDRSASALIFQHFAIVTRDMAQAWRALQRTEGWSRITAGDPQRLPDRAGGVTAFKFRDPEGHPLELLSFPRDRIPPQWRKPNGELPCLGIDHSAIRVSNTEASTAFYAAHGLRVSGASRNSGIEQDRLDGLADTAVAVTALSPAIATPHVELLCYETPSTPPLRLAGNDIAATRLVFESPGAALPCRIADADGHHLLIFPQSNLPEAA